MTAVMRNCSAALSLLAVTACQAAVPTPAAADISVVNEATTVTLAGQANVPVKRLSFAQWLRGFEAEAAAAGISPKTLEQAFAGIRFNKRVIELDSRQPEFTRPIWSYLASGVSASRIARGRALLKQHAELLEKVTRQFGIQPQYIVAIWGLESDFGRAYGDFKVIQSLASLAYSGRRKAFGHQQLLAALRIVERGDIAPSRMLGSWAGAMGHTQFIPTTYLSYAVDFDGDGVRDLWNSLPDVFASTANYLAAVGWQRRQSWGLEVRLPTGFDWELQDPEVRKPLAAWDSLGLRKANGGTLAQSQRQAAVIVPASYQGPAFLVFNNFHAIMRYNNSTSYALAVGHLADRLTGHGPIVARWPTWLKPLSRSDKLELQSLLTQRGYELGAVDGIVGPRTRAAVKAFQAELNWPRDGYPSNELLNKLRTAVQNTAATP